MKTLSFLAAVVAVSSVYAAKVADVKVRSLDSFGGDVGAVVSRCQTRTGGEYDAATVSRDVTALKESGEFEDIRVEVQPKLSGDVEVMFSVKRKLRYHAPLRVVGAKVLSESKVADVAAFKDGYLYGEGDIAEAAQKVRDAYRKKSRPDVTVTPSVEFVGGNDCHLVFTINEGGAAEVRDYVFDGAVSVPVDELRAAIGDFPWWNWNGWFASSPTSDEQLAQSVAEIENVYRNHGFLDVKVSIPERVLLADDPGKCDILYKVVEGEQYKIGNSSIQGLTRYPEEAVKAWSKLPAAGEIAGAKTLQEAADRVRVAVGSAPVTDEKGISGSGIADTRVDIRRIPSETDPQALDIVYVVKEGVPVVIDDVVIRGNDYTKDKVFRRAIPLGPGDSMDERRAERGLRRLQNLDYFSRVRYYLEPSGRGVNENGAEYRNLVYEVDEKNTGSFMVGIGASSVDSVYVSAEVSQSNFDLFAPGKFFRGGGQKARAYVQWGPRIQTVEASISEPHLFDRYLELTVEGYRRGRWYDEYDLYRNGAAATLSYPVKFWPTWDPFGRLGFRLSGEFIQMDEVDSGTYTYDGYEGRYFVQQESDYGNAMEGAVRLFWSHDNCDSFRTPSSGGRSNIFVDLAAGDNSWWRFGLSHRQYIPVWRRFNHVLMINARAETMGAFSDDVPVYNRMFLGGPRSIRGIKYRNVSPLARRTDYGSNFAPIGGQTLFCMNFEYTIPIVKMLRLAVFSDLGAVGADEFDFNFADNFAWTVGLGIRLDIPMFPIRLDFATPFVKPDDAEDEVFSFTVGYDF